MSQAVPVINFAEARSVSRHESSFFIANIDLGAAAPSFIAAKVRTAAEQDKCTVAYKQYPRRHHASAVPAEGVDQKLRN